MKLIFATGNAGKIREAREILGPSFEIVSPRDLGIFDDPEETGSTFRENSLIKARAIYDATGLDCFADDSGLVVDALGGAPGIYSARYAALENPQAAEGDLSHNFAANRARLLRELGDSNDRSARFRCVVTLILGGEEYFFDGTMEGSIARKCEGDLGFGYDPLFIADDCPGMTLGQAGESVKNKVSHRGKALSAMAEFLATRK
ncbi:MAG: RdgB/HAM1 family non-canonical purine NTP pyrophosphatase [Bacteroidales bacterium]|nr:RdgB/HAM1 family non-canonical purine NTP pyrophosphatase [Candidatus Cryptobacteroides aphodequi]